MGPTGSGKTHVSESVIASNAHIKNAQFIDTLTEDTRRKAAGLAPTTQSVTAYTIPYRGLRLVLVDTPGFDDTYRPDTEILRTLADWLTKRYVIVWTVSSPAMQIHIQRDPGGDIRRPTGIIYLHRITDNRMSGAAWKNLEMFSRICGNIPLQRARLVTTMWDMAANRPGLAVAESREREIIAHFWQPLIAEGAVVKRFNNMASSAWQIVDELMALKNPKDELLLQEELLGQQKRLNETEAGKFLYFRLQKLHAEQRNTLKELADEAKLANDPSLARSLQEECDKINALLQKTSEEMKEMKIPLSRRALLQWSWRKPRGVGAVYYYSSTEL